MSLFHFFPVVKYNGCWDPWILYLLDPDQDSVVPYQAYMKIFRLDVYN